MCGRRVRRTRGGGDGALSGEGPEPRGPDPPKSRIYVPVGLGSSVSGTPGTSHVETQTELRGTLEVGYRDRDRSQRSRQDTLVSITLFRPMRHSPSLLGVGVGPGRRGRGRTVLVSVLPRRRPRTRTSECPSASSYTHGSYRSVPPGLPLGYSRLRTLPDPVDNRTGRPESVVYFYQGPESLVLD